MKQYGLIVTGAITAALLLGGIMLIGCGISWYGFRAFKSTWLVGLSLGLIMLGVLVLANKAPLNQTRGIQE